LFAGELVQDRHKLRTDIHRGASTDRIARDRQAVLNERTDIRTTAGISDRIARTSIQTADKCDIKPGQLITLTDVGVAAGEVAFVDDSLSLLWRRI
jgi:hypothetical protein